MLRRLLLFLCPLFLAETAIAFDGGGYEIEKKAELYTNQLKTKTLAEYSEFHHSCMDTQMTMWGEVMEDLQIRDEDQPGVQEAAKDEKPEP